MHIQIILTPSSIDEASDLFARLRGVAIEPAAATPVEQPAAAFVEAEPVVDDKPRRTRRTKAQIEAEQAAAAQPAAPEAQAGGADDGGDYYVLTPAARAAAQPAAAAAAAAQPAAAAALDYERDIKPTLTSVITKAGTPAIVALLAKFGVKRGQDVPAERLPELKVAVDALAAGEPQPAPEAGLL